MKIALVHDYIKEYGGAERVLEVLHEMYPKAPVFTTIYAPRFLGPHQERFKNWDIRPSFLRLIPFSYKAVSWYRLIAPFIFKTFDFSGFDLIIVSATGAYNPNVINKRGAKLICYCHTPPRYLYGYATAREKSKNPISKVFLALMIHVIRMVDEASSQNVDQFIANSQTVKQRIQKFYRKDAKVVYPPVDIPRHSELDSESPKSKQEIPDQVRDDKSGYFLTGGRLARPKHVDLIVKACLELGVPLKVFGRGFAGYEKELQSLVIARKSANWRKTKQSQKGIGLPRYARNDNIDVEFLGEVSDAQKVQLMSGARAFLFASEDEDFGIIPVEAMACGTPVIAYRSGGVMETVIANDKGLMMNDKKTTGIFFDKLTASSIMDAIKKFQKAKILPENCINQAKKFSREQFINQIQKIVNSI